MRIAHLFLLAALIAAPVIAQEPGADGEKPAADKPAADPEGAKTLSGMSILGNEETPKSLVIVPWKSSEMGDEQSMSDALDEQASRSIRKSFCASCVFTKFALGNSRRRPISCAKSSFYVFLAACPQVVCFVTFQNVHAVYSLPNPQSIRDS